MNNNKLIPEMILVPVSNEPNAPLLTLMFSDIRETMHSLNLESEDASIDHLIQAYKFEQLLKERL